MKKLIVILFAALLAAAPVFAAPTEQEVGDTLGGVMMVYALVVMSSMFGVMPEGADVKMEMQEGTSSLVLKNLDVQPLMASEAGMGLTASMNGDEEVPPVQFTHISGEISADEGGNLLLDVTLKGGPVKTLLMKMEEEEVVTFKADGRDYIYLTNDPTFLEMME
jgi:hypothetical protein